MPFDTILQSLSGGLVVSCQAPATSPLHNPVVIAAMAEAAVLRGAIGVRIDTPAHIQAVRKKVKAPIIGLWKQVFPDSEVYITPQFKHAQAIADAGADIIAIDATLRPRPAEEHLPQLISRIHQELGKPVMADIDTLTTALAAVEAGADLLGTTLYGYTKETKMLKPPGFQLLTDIVNGTSAPCISEGGIASPEAAYHALKLGAFAVVVGTAITGIDKLVEQYCCILCDKAVGG